MNTPNFSLMAVIVLGSAIALTPLARAQDDKEDEVKLKPPQRERAAARLQAGTKRLAEELKLTDEQKPKFEAVMKEQAEKQRELRQDTVLSQEERVAKVREMRQDIAGKVKAILSPEQYEQWEKLQRTARRARAARAEKLAPEKSAAEKPAAEKDSTEKDSAEK